MELNDIFPEPIVGIVREFVGVPYAEFKVIDDERIYRVDPLSSEIFSLQIYSDIKKRNIIWVIANDRIVEMDSQPLFLMSDTLLTKKENDLYLYKMSDEEPSPIEIHFEFDHQVMKLNEESFLLFRHSKTDYSSTNLGFYIYSTEGEIKRSLSIEITSDSDYFEVVCVVNSDTLIVSETSDNSNDLTLHVVDLNEGKIINSLINIGGSIGETEVSPISDGIVAVSNIFKTLIWKITESDYSRLEGQLYQILGNRFIVSDTIYEFDSILGTSIPILEVKESIPTLLHDNSLLLKYGDLIQIYDFESDSIISESSIESLNSNTPMRLLPNGDVFDQGKRKIIVYK